MSDKPPRPSAPPPSSFVPPDVPLVLVHAVTTPGYRERCIAEFQVKQAAKLRWVGKREPKRRK